MLFGAHSVSSLSEKLSSQFNEMYSKFSSFNDSLLRTGPEESHRINFVNSMVDYYSKLTGDVNSVEVSTADIERVFYESRPIVTNQIVESINSKIQSMNLSWKAGTSSKFLGAPASSIQKILGVKVEEFDDSGLGAMPEISHDNLPESYSVLTDWATKCPETGRIRDQANCGSCWAFASSEAFSDRLCIATDGKFNKPLSAQHTASCCTLLAGCMSFGCNGGQPAKAWSWFVSNGIVTGGGYESIDSGETCWPYEKAQCAHHVKDSKYPDCPPENDTPSCKSTCTSKKFPKPFEKDIQKAKSSYVIRGIENIKAEIFKKGPVTAAFTVYDDFPAYAEGIYSPTSKNALGGHAVKIVGWGLEKGIDYWLIANSWNEGWGEKGFFKIKMDTCGISNMVVAGEAFSISENENLSKEAEEESRKSDHITSLIKRRI